MKTAQWKKGDVKAAAYAIATMVEDAFAVDPPAVCAPEHDDPREWEYRFDTVHVWTKAGPAELNVTIDRHFAHLYFRFDDPARAATMLHGDRLNRHSGKWNRLSMAPDTLDGFKAGLMRDFGLVAEPCPDAGELADWKAKQKANADYWAQCRAEFLASKGAAQ